MRLFLFIIAVFFLGIADAKSQVSGTRCKGDCPFQRRDKSAEQECVPKDGIDQGTATCRYKDTGTISVVADFHGGRINGRFQEFERNGQMVIDATLQDNVLKSGSDYREYYPDGSLRFEGVVDDENWLNGVFYPFQGYRCTQDIVAGQRGKVRRCEYLDGSIFYEAKWSGDKIADQIVEHFYPNGDLYCRTEYRGNGRQGIVEYFWPSGHLAVRGAFNMLTARVAKGGEAETATTYVSTVQSGAWSTFYPDGTKRTTLSEPSKLVHIQTARWYHLNGQLGAKFRIGLLGKGGKAEYWNESGKLVRKEKYRNGELKSQKDYGGAVPGVPGLDSFVETDMEAWFAQEYWTGAAPVSWSDRPPQS